MLLLLYYESPAKASRKSQEVCHKAGHRRRDDAGKFLDSAVPPKSDWQRFFGAL